MKESRLKDVILSYEGFYSVSIILRAEISLTIGSILIDTITSDCKREAEIKGEKAGKSARYRKLSPYRENILNNYSIWEIELI